MSIHPTAIVEPGAILAENVEVGPWAYIGGSVKLGAGCVVQARATLDGSLEAGERNVFGYGCVVGAPPQDYAFDASQISGVRLGSGNILREYVTVHRGTKPDTYTVIGNDCFLMVGVHLGHNAQVADRVIITNNCLLGGYVDIGEGCVLGGGAILHQFLRVGKFAMVSGGARLNKDVPPYCIVDTKNVLCGINTIGLRRAGFAPELRTELRRAFRKVFHTNLNVGEAIALAKVESVPPEISEFFDFITSSKRGVGSTNRSYADEGEGRAPE
jgi:UDP-N-acetylglucosamine acyltransferase